MGLYGCLVVVSGGVDALGEEDVSKGARSRSGPSRCEAKRRRDWVVRRRKLEVSGCKYCRYLGHF